MWIKVENNVVVCITTIEMNGDGWYGVESVPTYEDIEGKYQELHYTPENGFWVIYVDDVPAPPPMEEDIEQFKQIKIAELKRYDKSDAVDEFFLNGNSMWVELEDRKSMAQSLNVLDDDEIWTYWYNLIPITLPVKTFRELMRQVERYALLCKNNTFQHERNIRSCQTIAEVENYDFTIGYPEKLRFNVE